MDPTKAIRGYFPPSPNFTHPRQAPRAPMPLYETAFPNKSLNQQDSARMVVIFGLVEHVPVQAA